MKGYFILPRAPELEPHYLMRFSFILRMPIFLRVTPLARGHSRRIPSLADRANVTGRMTVTIILLFGISDLVAAIPLG